MVIIIIAIMIILLTAAVIYILNTININKSCSKNIKNYMEEYNYIKDLYYNKKISKRNAVRELEKICDKVEMNYCYNSNVFTNDRYKWLMDFIANYNFLGEVLC